MELKELVKIKGGKRLPKGKMLSSIANQHPYIKVRDMKPTTIQLNSDFEYVDNQTFKSISKYIVNTGDVILSIVGTIGNVSIIGKSLDNASLTENCVKFVCDYRLNPVYLFYFLSSNKGQEQIKQGIVGTTQPKLPLYNIEKINIPLYSKEKQQHIVNSIRGYSYVM